MKSCEKVDDIKFLAFSILFSISFLIGIFCGLNHKNSERSRQNDSQSVSMTEVSLRDGTFADRFSALTGRNAVQGCDKKQKNLAGLSSQKKAKNVKKVLAIRLGQWYYNEVRLRQICVEAGGCGTNVSVFPWSMSDFKPGDRYF